MQSNKQQDTGSKVAKGNPATVQNKPDEKRVPTVVPDNDNGRPGPSSEKKSSNKGQGPAGENL
jgi:hypothetical protein